MTTEYLEFNGANAVAAALADTGGVFRHCAFNSASLECGNFDGDFLACYFRDVEWYWGLFNTALFVDCSFERCTFRGTSFAECRFLECTFTDCQFLPDNLGSACSTDKTRLYACATANCSGLAALFQRNLR